MREPLEQRSAIEGEKSGESSLSSDLPNQEVRSTEEEKKLPIPGEAGDIKEDANQENENILDKMETSMESKPNVFTFDHEMPVSFCLLASNVP